jgi:ABC-2 type transport system permease protein
VSAVAAAVPPLVGATPPVSPSTTRLTLVELRKMADTRSARWMLAAVQVLSVAVTVVALVLGHRDDHTFVNFLALSALPAAALLPVLGVLLVTAEWSQRTVLTTFVLSPRRLRVAGAKIMAGMLSSAGSLAIALAVAFAGTGAGLALDRVDGGWHLPAAQVGQALLAVLLPVAMGTAFGLAFRSSPVAIVTYFLLPTLLSAIIGLAPRAGHVLAWLNWDDASSPLLGEHLTGSDWAHVATSAALWILLPLLTGLIRLTRGDLG